MPDIKNFVKICGVTSIEDAILVASSGADALGLILAPASKRRVSLDVATEISARPWPLHVVGVFRGQADEEIVSLVQSLGLRAVQLHDRASDELVQQLRFLGVTLLIRATSVGSDDFLSLDEHSVDVVLLDGAEPGSGARFTDTLASLRQFTKPVIVAGGLDSDNVTQVIESLVPSGVDVASGSEHAPGVKDATKVASFVRTARAAFAAQERNS